MLRTIAYNAAISGQRTLFIPLEMHYEEELSIFAMMHARNANYFEGTDRLTIERFEHGMLTDKERDFIASDLVPDLIRNVGDRLIILRPEDTSWPGVRSAIELQNFLTPLDVIAIDYFSLMNTNKAKDKTALINENAFDAKQFLLHDLDNGRGGVALVTPAQGSRKGLEDAKQNDGTWNREGVYMFSELEKSADMIMFAFMDAELQRTGFMKIGTCKSRRSADVPAQLVGIDHNTHMVGGSPRKETIPAGQSQMKDPNIISYKEHREARS